MPGPDDLGAYFAQRLLTKEILDALAGPVPRLPAPPDSEPVAPPQ